MKQRPHKSGEEFQENATRGIVPAVVVLAIILVAGVVLIVRGLSR